MPITLYLWLTKEVLSKEITAWKVPVFGVFLVRISLHSDWIRRDTEYLSVFIPNEGKYGSENSEYGQFSRTFSYTEWIAQMCCAQAPTPTLSIFLRTFCYRTPLGDCICTSEKICATHLWEQKNQNKIWISSPVIKVTPVIVLSY